MGNGIDLEKIDIMKLARSIERDCQEGVLWERRKLQWIMEEQQKRERAKHETDVVCSH